jgi:hypothetical protein
MWNCCSARIINPWLTLCVDHHGTPSSLVRILIDKPILIKIKESECADRLAIIIDCFKLIKIYFRLILHA